MQDTATQNLVLSVNLVPFLMHGIILTLTFHEKQVEKMKYSSVLDPGFKRLLL